MYHSKFVVALKVNGKILRERNGEVAVPFGSEYSIFLKNLNSVRAMARVDVDGQCATEKTWLVLQPHSSLELERYLKFGNLSAGNRFKFIERTAPVELHRGVGSDDGLVRVEFKHERIIQPAPPLRYGRRRTDYPPVQWWGGSGGLMMGQTGDANNQTAGPTGSRSLRERLTRNEVRVNESSLSDEPVSSSVFTCNTEGSVTMGSSGVGAVSAPPPIESTIAHPGITVEGSISNQQFCYVDGFPCEEPAQVMVLRLVGRLADEAVARPLTVDQKLHCRQCGLANPGSSQFCSRCGAGLVIV